MDRLFPASRRLHRMVGPAVSRLTRLPVADDQVFAAGQRFYDQLDAVHRILADPTTTSARLVVNPERMVVAEARRTYTQLSLFGYHVDAVLVNRVLPDAVDDPWFDGWRATQTEHLAAIEQGFAPVPVLRSHLAPSEVVGIDALRELGEDLWSSHDPAARLVAGRPLRVDRDGDGYVLTVQLPFADRGDVDVTRSGDDLFITLGAHRRSLSLPEALRRRDVVSARVAGGALRVGFAERP
jgi:arsenite-transporting ATPase